MSDSKIRTDAIRNDHILGGIDAVKIANGSVSNTKFQQIPATNTIAQMQGYVELIEQVTNTVSQSTCIEDGLYISDTQLFIEEIFLKNSMSWPDDLQHSVCQVVEVQVFEGKDALGSVLNPMPKPTEIQVKEELFCGGMYSKTHLDRIIITNLVPNTKYFFKLVFKQKDAQNYQACG